jgi:hypothetical protein
VDVEIKGEMNADIRITVVENFEAGRLSHRTTNEALRMLTDNGLTTPGEFAGTGNGTANELKVSKWRASSLLKPGKEE